MFANSCGVGRCTVGPAPSTSESGGENPRKGTNNLALRSQGSFLRGDNGLYLHELVRAPGEKGICGGKQSCAKATVPEQWG